MADLASLHCRQLGSKVENLNMSLRHTLLAAFIAAIATVLFATWLTSGPLEPIYGKQLFFVALIVVPFVVAAKNDIDGAGAFALVFVTYFAIAFSPPVTSTTRVRHQKTTRAAVAEVAAIISLSLLGPLARLA